MPSITTADFLRRFATKTGANLKDAKPILHMIEDEIGKALASGRDVRLMGLGLIKRARFSSKILPNPNNRAQKLLVLDRYYPRLRTSSTLKNKLKHIIFDSPLNDANPSPAKLSAKPPVPKSKYLNPKSGTPIPISFRPRVPPLRWRKEVSPLYLDLSKNNLSPVDCIVKGLLRNLHRNEVALSIAPQVMTYYGAGKYHQSLSPEVYRTLIGSFRRFWPKAFSEPQVWRLMVNLPPQLFLNFSAAPAGDDDWLVHFAKPRLTTSDHANVHTSFSPELSQNIDGLFERGGGRVAVIGPARARLATLHKIKKILDNEGINYHYVVEHHHWKPHPHEAMTPHLKQLMKKTARHPILIIEHLSSADDIYHLNRFDGIVITGLMQNTKHGIGELLARHKLPDDFFDLIIESHAIPSPCPNCPPLVKPAILFSPLCQIAARRGEALGNRLVSVAQASCPHKTSYQYASAIFDSSGLIGPSLEEQLYHMVLDQKVPFNAAEELL